LVWYSLSLFSDACAAARRFHKISAHRLPFQARIFTLFWEGALTGVLLYQRRTSMSKAAINCVMELKKPPFFWTELTAGKENSGCDGFAFMGGCSNSL